MGEGNWARASGVLKKNSNRRYYEIRRNKEREEITTAQGTLSDGGKPDPGVVWMGAFVGPRAASATRWRTMAEVPFTQAGAFGKLRGGEGRGRAAGGEGSGLKDGSEYE